MPFFDHIPVEDLVIVKQDDLDLDKPKKSEYTRYEDANQDGIPDTD